MTFSDMAQRSETKEAKSAMALFREGLLRSYQEELVSISIKRASMVAAAAARAAVVSVELSHRAMDLAGTRGDGALASGQLAGRSSQGPRAA